MMAARSSLLFHCALLLLLIVMSHGAGATTLDSLPRPCTDRRWSDAEAESLLNAVPDSLRQDTALTFQLLAQKAWELNAWDCSVALMEEARRAYILKKNYNGAAKVHLQLAGRLMQRQQTSQAIDELRRALQLPALNPATMGQLQQALMNAWLLRDNESNALIHGRLAAQFFQLCGADCDAPAAEVLMVNAFVQIRKGNLPDARKLLEEAQQLLRQTNTAERSPAWISLHLLWGDLYAAWNENEEALRRYHRALMAAMPGLNSKDYRVQPDTILPHEQPALAKILAGKADAFRTLYLKTKRTEQLARAAACYRLSQRAEALLRAPAGEPLHPFFRIATRERNQDAIETALELARLQTSITSAEPAFAAAEHEKEQLLKKYLPTRLEHAVTLAEMQQALPGNDIALVEYVTGAQRIFVFIITQTQYEAISLPLDFPLENWMTQWRKDMEAYPNSGASRELLCKSYSAQAYRLYEKLIRPVEKAVSLPERLIIIPSAELSWIPFEALLTEAAPAGCDYKNYPFLLRRYSISYGLSAALQQELMLRPSVQGGYLGLAPVWPERYDAERSLLRVQQTAERLRGKVLLRDEARQEALSDKPLRKSILHLSAPAQSLLPTAAFVLLSDGQGGTDTLHAAEIQALHIKTNLIVLDQHFSNTQGMDAIVWQAGSWLHTGARSVLMPVWTPPGDASDRVQALFFDNLHQAQPKDVALRNAKLQYLLQADSTAIHPAYWAAWALVGDAGAQKQESAMAMKYWLVLLPALMLAGIAMWRRLRKHKRK